MEQTPIFESVERDLGLEYATIASPPYDFEQHDAEVRRRIAARHAAEEHPPVAPPPQHADPPERHENHH